MDDNLKASIARALLVLREALENARIGRKKFEPGGNLYMLIEKGSTAAVDKLAQIDQEILELEGAVAYLERQ